jgi:ribonuclease-3
VSDEDTAPAQRALEAAVGHSFRDPELAERALRHASFAHEGAVLPSNERLEFLGDAVLGLVVAEHLYRDHPDWNEGALTRARAALVNRSALAGCARALGLGPLLRLGRTEQLSGGGDKDSILANCFEAVLGAVYLDGGLEPAIALAQRALGSSTPGGPPPRDPKTAFQEWAHARLQQTPSYRTSEDSGIEDDDARFTVEVRIGDECWGRGPGRTKRAAEREAALRALEGAGRSDG